MVKITSFRDWAIKTKLLAIFIPLICISVLLVSFLIFSTAEKVVFNEVQEKLQKQVDTYGQLLDVTMQQISKEAQLAKAQAQVIVSQQAKLVSRICKNWDKDDLEPLKQALADVVVGKTGYIFVLDYDGKYIVSKGRKSDGKDISSIKDASGRLFIKDIISKGQILGDDGLDFDIYPWQNAGEQNSREKIAAIIHVPKYKWVIGVSAYFDDLVDMEGEKKAFENYRTQLLASKVGTSGYLFVMDGKFDLIMHPTSEGKNIAKAAFAQMMKERKRGVLEYEWEGKSKVMAFTHYEPRDWYIGASGYTADFMGQLQKVKGITVAVSLGMILAAIFISLWVAFLIAGPLQKVISMLKDISEGEGDLTKRIDASGADETGRLAQYFNRFIGQMESMIVEIKSSADQIQGATQEVSSGAQQISDGAQQQSASFEQLSSSVQANAENVRNANQIAQGVSQNAAQAGQAMDNTVESMSEIEKGAKQMSEAAELITEIADQTNLLALNAAIEAARAGEHGKGFAVVAAEVRQLAERSSTTAKEIQSLIKETLRKVEGGVRVSKEAGERTREIIGSVKKIADEIGAISNATQEQAAAMEENTSITESNASAAEELAASSEEMSSQAEALRNVVAQFKTTHGSSMPEVKHNNES